MKSKIYYGVGQTLVIQQIFHLERPEVKATPGAPIRLKTVAKTLLSHVKKTTNKISQVLEKH